MKPPPKHGPRSARRDPHAAPPSPPTTPTGAGCASAGYPRKRDRSHVFALTRKRIAYRHRRDDSHHNPLTPAAVDAINAEMTAHAKNAGLS